MEMKLGINHMMFYIFLTNVVKFDRQVMEDILLFQTQHHIERVLMMRC
jgi:hypothetical protein